MYCRNKKEGPVFHANIHKGKFKLILHEHIQTVYLVLKRVKRRSFFYNRTMYKEQKNQPTKTKQNKKHENLANFLHMFQCSLDKNFRGF